MMYVVVLLLSHQLSNMSQSQQDHDKFIIRNAECELLKVLQEMIKSADVSDFFIMWFSCDASRHQDVKLEWKFDIFSVLFNIFT